jgi:hypothetical protein
MTFVTDGDRENPFREGFPDKWVFLVPYNFQQ